MGDTLHYAQLNEALVRLGFSQEPAEYHGALCGALCVRASAEIDPLNLLEPSDDPAEDTRGAEGSLQSLREHCAESLEDAQAGFAPLLPPDADVLNDRIRALTSWCDGFLYGLTTGRPLNMKGLSPEFKEIVKDFTEFTRAGFEGGDDSELEENAYTELVEYIRVGVQLIYLELHGQPASDIAQPPTVH